MIPQMILFPQLSTWQEPYVEVGDQIAKRQLLAQGTTHIYFQANVWIFTFFVFIIGLAMGIGKAGVYKYIPDYFPDEVGVVGGNVGVVGGLGGFVCPIIFGLLLKSYRPLDYNLGVLLCGNNDLSDLAAPGSQAHFTQKDTRLEASRTQNPTLFRLVQAGMVGPSRNGSNPPQIYSGIGGRNINSLAKKLSA